MKPILFSTPMVEAILAGRKTQTRRIIKSRHESGLFQVCKRATTGEVINIESLDWDERNCEKDITPRYNVGDVLYVRENWKVVAWDFEEYECTIEYSDEQKKICYLRSEGNVFTAEWLMNYLNKLTKSGVFEKHVGTRPFFEPTGKPIPFKPSIHMPIEASRIFLVVTDVRVERLNDINEADAVAEGIESQEWTWGPLAYPDGTIDHSISGTKTMWYRDYSKEKYWSNITPVKSYKTLWDSINGDGSWDLNPWVWVYEFVRVEDFV